MHAYAAPLQDYRFLVTSFLRLPEQREMAGYEDLTTETLDAVIAGGARLCETVLAPLNAAGDSEGCILREGKVTTPAGFGDAYRSLVEGGWIGLALDPTHGGQGLPGVLAEIFYEMMVSSNMAFSGFAELTEGAFHAIHLHGDSGQKRLFLPPLASGRWSGAMHLTEPQAGSDLRLVRTRAEPAGDGSYVLNGTKVFITAAEHDLTENIVHLVLARISGAPEGTAGLSLFVAPKFRIAADGTLGQRNGINCISLEHKMGLRGLPTGTIAYENAVGHLVGAPNSGMAAMFTMINDTRLGVAIQGLGIAEVALQRAASYARERRQGRAPGRRASGGDPADPIILHPDIRRMLMSGRAFVQGARALAVLTAYTIDRSRRHPDDSVRADAADRAALLTPVIKAHFTDMGWHHADQALQCFGGYGYVRETGIEQLLRDVRVTRIYEGTNAIQALDLVQRKLTAGGGRPVARLFDEIAAQAVAATTDPRIADFGTALAAALADLRVATDWMAARRGNDPVAVAAGASDYLRLFALTCLGWIWTRTAELCADSAVTGSRFHADKMATGRYFIVRDLPETELLLKRVLAGAEAVMGIDPDSL